MYYERPKLKLKKNGFTFKKYKQQQAIFGRNYNSRKYTWSSRIPAA